MISFKIEEIYVLTGILYTYIYIHTYIQSNIHNSKPRNSNFSHSKNLFWSRQICHTIPIKQTPVIRTPLIRTFYNSNYICLSLQGKYPL